MQWLLDLPSFDAEQIATAISKSNHLVVLFPHQDQKSRDLTKEVLAHLTKISPREIKFSKNEHGKPFWPDSPRKFNASDSGEFMLLGFSKNQEIGVDIERVRELRYSGKFPDRIMTDLEQKDFAALPSEQHLTRLIQSWSLKEAVLKCQGGSFFRDAHRIGLCFDPLQLRELPNEFGRISDWEIEQTIFKNKKGDHFQISLAVHSIG